VREVDSPTVVETGSVYIARGGSDMTVTMRAGRLMAVPRPESAAHLWHPSVELLAQSALEHWDPTRLVAVMLTGMGNDGAATFAEIKRRGGRTIAESEETAVVYGMPADLVHRGGASLVLPADRIAGQLSTWASR
jgi:two-component system, chemotaxis family, protein-glutamate methylesterase/glutaminase